MPSSVDGEGRELSCSVGCRGEAVSLELLFAALSEVVHVVCEG